MKSVEWITYRTRFLVKAKQLNSSLSFTDHLGRQHCGRKGDYLVESCDGVLTITPRRIFEDIYVPMTSTPDLSPHGSAPGTENESLSRDHLHVTGLRLEPLQMEKIACGTALQKAPRANKKSPQSVQVSPTRLGLM